MRADDWAVAGGDIVLMSKFFDTLCMTALAIWFVGLGVVLVMSIPHLVGFLFGAILVVVGLAIYKHDWNG